MSKYIDIHTHQRQSNNATEVLSLAVENFQLESNYCSVGIHPWDVEKVDEEASFKLLYDTIEKYEQIIGLGECGIDRAIATPIPLQEKYFMKQAEMAEQVKKPVIIHCVKAWSDILKWRKRLNPKMPWIIHGFNGNIQIAGQLISHGCFLSFGTALLSQKKVQAVFKEQKLEHVFFETDDEETDIEKIYLRAAEWQNINLENLKQSIASNFKKVFNRDAE